MSNRKVEYDYYRCFLCIYIVGVWHLSQYCGIAVITHSKILHSLTVFCLSAFFFLSGFLQSSKSVSSVYDVMTFYKKRFFRLYIPLVICILLLPIVGFKLSVRQTLLSLILLSAFVPPMPETAWFGIVLCLFWFISPAIMQFNKKTYKKLIVILTILFILLIEHFFIGGFDERLLMYAPFYFIGLICNNNVLNKLTYKISFIISFVILIISFILTNTRFYEMTSVLICNNLIGGIAFIIVLNNICLLISKAKLQLILDRLLNSICYSSLFLYLFHRHIFYVLTSLYHVAFSTSGAVSKIYAFAFMLPLSIIICYSIQAVYDYLLVKIPHNHKTTTNC